MRSRFDEDIWLLERLSQGPYYDIHLAFWPQENERVLVKKVRDDIKNIEEDRIKVEQRLLKEAATLEEFWSDYFPKMYDIRRNEDGVLYIITQYFCGLSLRQYLDLVAQDKKLDPKNANFIINELKFALSYLHNKKNLIHFDLSPDNIIIDDDNKLHLIDFEDAKVIGQKIEPHEIRGKENYISPLLKQATNEITISADFDIYALDQIIKEINLKTSLFNFSFQLFKIPKLQHFKFKKASFAFTSVCVAIFLLISMMALLPTTTPTSQKAIKTVHIEKESQPTKITRSPALPSTNKKQKRVTKIKKKKNRIIKKKKKTTQIKKTFNQLFSQALAPKDKQLKHCLNASELTHLKTITLAFKLQKNDAKLLSVSIRSPLTAKSSTLSSCLKSIYQSVDFPIHPSGAQVEITQSISFSTKVSMK